MKHISLNYRNTNMACIPFLLFICTTVGFLVGGIPFSVAGAGSNVTDKLALLKIKAEITVDPLGVTRSWNDTIHFCKWYGVSCGRLHQRVTALDLGGSHLKGTVSPFIGNLSFMSKLNMSFNGFSGTIPAEMGLLRRLQFLLLSHNSFRVVPRSVFSLSALQEIDLENNQLEGSLPSDFGVMLPNLQFLYMNNNNFSGSIPASLFNLSALQELDLSSNQLGGSMASWFMLPNLQLFFMHDNNFWGTIPASFFNLSTLEQVDLGTNQLRGSLPSDFGVTLPNLQHFVIKNNEFSGFVPASLYNLSALEQVDLGTNRFEGSLPSDFGVMLPNLQYFAINNNSFSGSIPVSISNCSNLVTLVMSGNRFRGQVPSLQGLDNLQYLFLFDNFLGIGEGTDFDFVSSMANATMLKRFVIGNNRLSGTFPRNFCNFSELNVLTFGENNVTGEIPSCIANLVQLTSLDVRENYLVGAIPQSIGMLQSLFILQLAGNLLSGHIPSSLGNLTLLTTLILSENQFQGQIPSELGNCVQLTGVDLSYNNLSGRIPPEVLQLSSLSIYLNLSNNGFTGPLPYEVGKLVNLVVLDISDTLLSGEIPSSIGSCIELQELYLEGNSFHGVIPNTLTSLNGLQILDLSRNNLSGAIPEFPPGFKLEKLNISYNNLEGEVPTSGVFNTTGVSVSGNSLLCGGLPRLKLHSCNSNGDTHNRRFGHRNHIRMGVLFGVSGLIFLVACVSLYILFCRKRIRKPTGPSDLESSLENMSYQMLHRVTSGFSNENFIGSGASGVVYKGTLNQDVGTMLAIKIFNLENHGASKSFVAECNALRNIRHRNLIKVLTACSSLDYQGKDFKALVYEYMVNGSLDDWLHPSKDINENGSAENSPRNLNLRQRLEIAVDVAFALEYLHHQCGAAVVHCDLKPSNVLLDEDMVAHVADFGLAKFLSPDVSLSSAYQPSSVGVRGTIGYAPPEYGMGNEVSISGDVYSFGILVLEMFTGKRPTDVTFREGMSLHDFVKVAMADMDIKILDPALLNDIVGEDSSNQIVFEALISVLEIAVTCCADSARERPDMTVVSAEMFSIRNKLQAPSKSSNSERSCIPSIQVD